jgi:hypothetical protein
MPRWALSICVIFAMIGLAAAQAPPVQPQQQMENLSQNDAERWVWSAIQAGRPADLNERDKLREPLDPRKPEVWDESRTLRAAFLKEILFREPYRSAIPIEGVRIIGARFAEKLDLAHGRLERQLGLEKCRFEQAVDLTGLRIDDSLSLEGSTVAGEGPALDGTTFQAVDLTAAKVDGQLSLDGATVTGEITADSLQVGASLLLRGATFKQALAITFAQIEETLDLRGAELPGLDLTSTTIGEFRLGDDQSPPPKWTANAETANAEQPSRLILRGTHTKILRDWLNASEPCPARDAWPSELDLQGFVYEQLGADPGPGTDMRERAPCWYEKWLRRDPHFAPQPYQQLAGVLRATGAPGRADAVLYAARERERALAWEKGEWWRAVMLSLLKWLIGYGIGSKAYPVFGSILAITLFGMLVLSFSPKAREKGALWMFGASFDQLLPIVSLNQEFADFFNDPERKHLEGWQVAYFVFHTLFGLLLGSFVVAALAGLTQTG